MLVLAIAQPIIKHTSNRGRAQADAEIQDHHDGLGTSNEAVALTRMPGVTTLIMQT